MQLLTGSLTMKPLLAYFTLLYIKVNNHTYFLFEQLIIKFSCQFKLASPLHLSFVMAHQYLLLVQFKNNGKKWV